MKSKPTRRLAGTLLVLAVLTGIRCLLPQSRAAPDPPAGPAPPAADRSAPPGPPGSVPPAAREMLRISRNIPGDAKPLLLTADRFATWVEKGKRVILMQGKVLIQQGVVRVRCEEAVAVVFLDQLQRTGVLHADVYAERSVHVEDGRGEQRGQRALLDLNTRGEMKITAQYERVLQKPLREAAIFARAVESLYNLTPSGEVVPVRAESTQPGPPVTPVKRTASPAPRPEAPPPPPGYVPTPPPGPGAADLAPPVPRGGPTFTPPLPPGSMGAAPSSYPKPTVVRASGHALFPGAVAVSSSLKAAQLPDPVAPPPPAIPGAAPGPGPRLLQPSPGGGPLRQYNVAPRTGNTFQLKSEMLPTGEQASIFTGGVIISVRTADGSDLIDIEADNALIWSRGGLTQQMIENLRTPQGQASRELEFYFSGNVQVRSQTRDGSRLLEADEIYLDASRNVALALSAELAITRPGMEQPVHVRAEELRQLSATRFEALSAEVFSSKLPSDPGLRVNLAQVVVEEQRVPLTTLFGSPIVDRAGNPVIERQLPLTGRNAVVELGPVPIFYLPWFKADAEDPFGPLENIRIGGNRIFGFELGASFDVYDLFNLQPIPDSRWRLDVDYLSRRGPALGTTFDSSNITFFEMPALVTTQVKAYGIHDDGTDILGGGRGEFEDHPDLRGRLTIRQNVQELPNGFVLQGQLNALSDRNFLEQFFKQEFDNDLDRTTFLYLKQSHDSWAWTALGQPRLRDWATVTEWLPRVDGHLLGLSFFDLVTYHGTAGAGYARLEPSEDPLPPVSSTDQRIDTGRFHVFQEVNVPFYAGPIKVVPYGVSDLAYYTSDLSREDSGRAWGGVGLRTSLPLTRLYPDAKSLLFNVNGLMHKVVLRGNYLVAGANESYLNYPQLDRLNDHPTDQALRDIRPVLPSLNPANGIFLATSQLYDPQSFAIRRLVQNRFDAFDDIQVVQLGMRQRLQTKRGFPGRQHIIDWMTLDVSTSIFPAKDRDNFGSTVAFIEYDYLWNIGDRTALTSTGWYDPIEHGARVSTVGLSLDRPDRTNFYLGYRQIDPLQSKAVTGSVTYVFSPKYAMTGSSTYDFGISESLSNSVVFTRMGADLNVGVGFTYNALQKNFGVLFEILPSLLAGRSRPLGAGSGAGGLVNR